MPAMIYNDSMDYIAKFRVTNQQRDALKHQAKREGRTMSQLMRRVISTYMKHVSTWPDCDNLTQDP